MKRRHFLGRVSAALAAPGLLASAVKGTSGTELDPIASPVFLQQRHFPVPVVLESLDLFEREGNWFVRARSTDGAEGWAVSHPSQMKLFYPILLDVVAPHFTGKDVRKLDSLLDSVFLEGSNYKMQGQPFWIPVASAEFAILDLLGRVANKPVGELLGGILRTEIPLYIANNHRQHDAEESLRRIIASVDRIQARALKFKLGGRMKVVDQVPGSTEKLIPLVAEALGDRCTLYADANSSYLDIDYAIRIGRMLEDHGYAFYEEPCPFDYLEETKRVADALEIPVAWGEQESSQWRFKWMIENGGVQVPQPDLFYYGGMIRSLRVAKWAEARGLPCTLHISGGGLGFLYMGIFASCCPNPGAHQEYKGISREFPWSSTGDPIEIKAGVMKAPTGPGIGVDIDPNYLKGARKIGHPF
ncbi:MAG: mandelate racemase/muconate lactonizing enzyme family protein [Verrucomicrobiae bacterium]|nr:mandelate racemase/muconate lactonizing enzyme family protein [Verrucomicrobiae bacterium]